MEYKPLSELHKDKTACSVIFDFIREEAGSLGKVEHNVEFQFLRMIEFIPDYYDEYEPFHTVYINYDGGAFEHAIEDKDDKLHDVGIDNPFELFDLIRSLGYSA